MKNPFQNKVIKKRNLPARLPVTHTVIVFLALDYWDAPQWLWGALGLFMLLVWIVSIIGIVSEEEIDIFKDKE